MIVERRARPLWRLYSFSKAVIEYAQRRISARIGIVERADERRTRKGDNVEVDPAGWQVYLLDVLAHRPGHLRQERAQRPQPVGARDFARLPAEQQAEVVSQAASDRVIERQSKGSRRGHSRGHAALKLDLLSEER